MMISATSVDTPREARRPAAEVVCYLKRLKAIAAAIEESGLRLRVCVTRRAEQAEEHVLESLIAQGKEQIQAARNIIQVMTFFCFYQYSFCFLVQ
jgi:hypothetical protein